MWDQQRTQRSRFYYYEKFSYLVAYNLCEYCEQTSHNIDGKIDVFSDFIIRFDFVIYRGQLCLLINPSITVTIHLWLSVRYVLHVGTFYSSALRVFTSIHKNTVIFDIFIYMWFVCFILTLIRTLFFIHIFIFYKLIFLSNIPKFLF